MNGFVKNVSHEWAYAMKRAVKPGGEIPLDELYEQYGRKYCMQPNDEFVKWLTGTKLRGNPHWKVVFSVDEAVSLATPKEEIVNNTDVAMPMATKNLNIEDIVTLTVRKARIVIPKVNDLNLLKYALNEVNQLSNKDNLCRLLQKRIKELQISR